MRFLFAVAMGFARILNGDVLCILTPVAYLCLLPTLTCERILAEHESEGLERALYFVNILTYRK